MRHPQSSVLGHLLDKEIEFWLQDLCRWSTIISKFYKPACMMAKEKIDLRFTTEKNKLCIKRKKKIV